MRLLAPSNPLGGKISVPRRRLQRHVLQSSPETHQIHPRNVCHHRRLFVWTHCDLMVKWKKRVPETVQKFCRDSYNGDGRVRNKGQV